MTISADYLVTASYTYIYIYMCIYTYIFIRFSGGMTAWALASLNNVWRIQLNNYFEHLKCLSWYIYIVYIYAYIALH